MITSSRIVGQWAMAGLVSLALIANRTAAQQPPAPLRTLSAPVATDSGIFRSVTTIRALSDGRVIVNDASRRRVVLFDSSLRSFTVLADTAAGVPNKYPALRQAGIFAYLGDSTIFVDTESQSLVVIEPSGKFGRVMAPPRPSDISYLAASTFGTPGFDPQGRLVYRGYRRGSQTFADFVDSPSSEPKIIAGKPDSAPIVRASFETRSVDTVGYMRLPVEKTMQIGNTFYSSFNPLPLTDEWAMLPDGTVAIARYHDYHIDLWAPDGKRTSTPKIPFEWRAISTDQRQALIDSIKLADEVRRAALPPLPPPPPGRPASVRRPIFTVDAEDMWDYYPPIRPGQMRVDRDGNIWILPSTSSAAGNGLVFDVVSKSGTLVERVRLPQGRNLIGFGPNQAVYMIYAPSPQRILLERATVSR